MNFNEIVLFWQSFAFKDVQYWIKLKTQINVPADVITTLVPGSKWIQQTFQFMTYRITYFRLLSLGSALNSLEAQLPWMQLITDSKHAKIFQYYSWAYPLPCSPWKIYLLYLTFGAPSRFQDTQMYLHFLPSLGIQNIFLREKKNLFYKVNGMVAFGLVTQMA